MSPLHFEDAHSAEHTNTLWRLSPDPGGSAIRCPFLIINFEPHLFPSKTDPFVAAQIFDKPISPGSTDIFDVCCCSGIGLVDRPGHPEQGRPGQAERRGRGEQVGPGVGRPAAVT